MRNTSWPVMPSMLYNGYPAQESKYKCKIKIDRIFHLLFLEDHVGRKWIKIDKSRRVLWVLRSNFSTGERKPDKMQSQNGMRIPTYMAWLQPKKTTGRCIKSQTVSPFSFRNYSLMQLNSMDLKVVPASVVLKLTSGASAYDISVIFQKTGSPSHNFSV